MKHDDLVKRLLANGLDECDEAVAVIEALTAKLAGVEAERDKCMDNLEAVLDQRDVADARAEAAEAERDAALQREKDANAKAMQHLRRAERAEITSKNHAGFSNEWRSRAEKAKAERDALLESGLAAYFAGSRDAEARERDAYARGFEAGLEKAAEWFDENKDDYDRLEPCVVASMLRAIPLPDK